MASVGRLGEVLGQAGLDVVGELAAAALHVDVGGVTALERGVELGEHVLVLHRVDLDGHAGVRGLEVLGDLVVVALAGVGVGVVPPRDRRRATGPARPAGAVAAALAARAAGGQDGHRRAECDGPCHRGCSHLDALLAVERVWDGPHDGTASLRVSIVFDNVIETLTDPPPDDEGGGRDATPRPGDDGGRAAAGSPPSPSTTDPTRRRPLALLDLLRRHRVRATFCVVGPRSAPPAGPRCCAAPSPRATGSPRTG